MMTNSYMYNSTQHVYFCIADVDNESTSGSSNSEESKLLASHRSLSTESGIYSALRKFTKAFHLEGGRGYHNNSVHQPALISYGCFTMSCIFL